MLVPTFYDPGLAQLGSFYVALQAMLFIVVGTVTAVALAVAILRYRLWDIDVIIRRTLIYGSLTALLAAVYSGLVLSLEALAGALTGQRGQQPVIIVGPH
jgi:hypothetical protein